MDAVQADLDGTSRGGKVFEKVVESWKSGEALPPNLDLARLLGWGENAAHASEGFRKIREYLDDRVDGQLLIRVTEWKRKLVIHPRSMEPARRMLLLAIPAADAGELGEITKGVLAGGIRIETALTTDPADETRQLDASGHLYRIVLPASTADEAGAFHRLAGAGRRTVLLDASLSNSSLPCVTFDYAGAGLYCAEQLAGQGAQHVFVLALRPDSRVQAVELGVRRRPEGRETLYLEPGWLQSGLKRLVQEKFGLLQSRGFGGPGRGIGVICMGAGVGQEVLQFLRAAGPASWIAGVAIMSGKPPEGETGEWPESVHVTLNYETLAAQALRVLQSGETPVPVAPVYLSRKPPRREDTSGPLSARAS
ncbi:MAG: hypothetical protein FJW30_22915 [Acidobacteria bacterium]|nr:hypothetical protein [Acidobacteriota bacterium]